MEWEAPKMRKLNIRLVLVISQCKDDDARSTHPKRLPAGQRAPTPNEAAPAKATSAEPHARRMRHLLQRHPLLP